MTSVTGFDSITYEAGEAVGADSNEIWYLTTTAAVTKGTFVQLASAGTCAPATATVGGHVGIALKTVASGAVCPVLVAGYGTVTADATGVKIGEYVKPTAAAVASKATFGTDKIVGIAANASGANGVAVIKLMALGA